MDALRLLALFLNHPAPVGLTILGLVLGMVIGGMFDAMAVGLLASAMLGLAIGVGWEVRKLVGRGHG